MGRPARWVHPPPCGERDRAAAAQGLPEGRYRRGQGDERRDARREAGGYRADHQPRADLRPPHRIDGQPYRPADPGGDRERRLHGGERTGAGGGGPPHVEDPARAPGEEHPSGRAAQRRRRPPRIRSAVAAGAQGGVPDDRPRSGAARARARGPSLIDRAPARPSRRLRKAPWKAGDYLALDFEATGPDLEHDRIVSFGGVPIRGGRVDVGEARYQLVDPGDRINEHGAGALHGIRPVDLVGASSQEIAKTALAEALDRRFLVAWHAFVEAGFLARLFGVPARSWLRRTIDVRDLLIEMDGERFAQLSLTE